MGKPVRGRVRGVSIHDAPRLRRVDLDEALPAGLKGTFLPHSEDGSVGEFEPWMEQFINPSKPGLDEETFTRLLRQYHEERSENFKPGFDRWCKAKIANAIKSLFEEQGE